MISTNQSKQSSNKVTQWDHSKLLPLWLVMLFLQKIIVTSKKSTVCIQHTTAYVCTQYMSHTCPHRLVYVPTSLPLSDYKNMLSIFHFVPKNVHVISVTSGYLSCKYILRGFNFQKHSKYCFYKKIYALAVGSSCLLCTVYILYHHTYSRHLVWLYTNV